MKEEDIIAKKSSSNCIYLIIIILMCIYQSIRSLLNYINHIDEKDLLFLIFIPASIILLILIIIFFRLPNILISKDKDRIIIHYPKIAVPLNQLINLIPRNASFTRYLKFSFGNIIITTVNNGKIKIRNIAQVFNVTAKIMSLIKIQNISPVQFQPQPKIINK